MSMTFGRINLAKIQYTATLEHQMLNPVPVQDLQKVYRAYCAHRSFHSVIPMVPGRFLVPGTEVFGYYGDYGLMAWSMYRLWDDKNLVCDHHAWDYKIPQLRLGITSFEHECAVYRDRGFEYLYLESLEPYMQKMQGFEILGGLQ